VVIGVGDATNIELANLALRFGAGARYCPQIHDRLVDLADILSWGVDLLTDRPQLGLDRFVPG
jgi:hypothetical protein